MASAATDVPRRDLTEDQIMDIIRAEVRERESAAAQYARLGHHERARTLQTEAAVLVALIQTGFPDPAPPVCHPLAMRIVHPGLGPGLAINDFGSAGASRLGGVRFAGPGRLTFLRLEPGSHLGRHPTVLTQVYCVVDGSGWVSGGDGDRVALELGQAAVWEPGEEHESGTDTGMVVAVLEVSSVRAD